MLHTVLVLLSACASSGLYATGTACGLLTRRAAVIGASTALASPLAARASPGALDADTSSAASPSDSLAFKANNAFAQALETEALKDITENKEIFLTFGCFGILAVVGEFMDSKEP